VEVKCGRTNSNNTKGGPERERERDSPLWPSAHSTLRNCRLLRKNPLVRLTSQSHHPLPSLDVSAAGSGVEITLSLVPSNSDHRSPEGKHDSGQWEESSVPSSGSPERGILCYFTRARTQFFCFLQYHLLVLQGPVTTLTELPWCESHHNRKTSPRPTLWSLNCYLHQLPLCAV
jgi:hypothetical protein